MLDSKVFLELRPFLFCICQQQIAGLIKPAGTVIAGIFLKRFKDMRAFNSQGGIKQRTPLLANAGAATTGSTRGEVFLISKQDI